ncbi:hypothetical protein [Chryseobacterium sp. G0201]|nr:hypothetical protein [Chryseobacterium sp. G0201]
MTEDSDTDIRGVYFTKRRIFWFKLYFADF